MTAMVLLACSASCSQSHGEAAVVDDASCLPPDAPGRFFWFLVHPTQAPPDGPGIYLYDEDSEEIVCKVELPEPFSSPHALAYDGELLWVGGIVNEDPMRGAILAIDPKTGEVVDELVTTGMPEGLAVAGDTLWYGANDWPDSACRARLVQIDRDGEILDELVPERCLVQDIAKLDDRLFYVVNDEADRILEVMPDGSAEREVASRAGGNAVYTLSSRLGRLVVEGYGALHWFDPDSGEAQARVPHNVPGWITAIAPTSDP